MANVSYNRAAEMLLEGTLNMTSDVLKCMLVTATYVPDPDDDFATTPAANEISVVNYTSGFAGSGRKTLATKVFAIDDSANRGTFGAANLTWTALGVGATIKWAVIYKHLTNDAASPLICALDLGAGTPTNTSDITISFGSGLVLVMTT